MTNNPPAPPLTRNPLGKQRRSPLRGAPATSAQIAARVVALRERRGLTQGDVAGRLGVPLKTYAGWEVRVELTAEAAGALARALDCPVGHLYGELPQADREGMDTARRVSRLPPRERRAVAALVDALLCGRGDA